MIVTRVKKLEMKDTTSVKIEPRILRGLRSNEIEYKRGLYYKSYMQLNPIESIIKIEESRATIGLHVVKELINKYKRHTTSSLAILKQYKC